MTDGRRRDAHERALIADLGDGLLLRHGSRDDADRLAAFNGDVHKRHDATEPSEGIAAWTRDLLERPHPTFAPHDFMLVEDTRTGDIVSSLNLISQIWSYDGIPFGVGRIELVGSHPHYRRRGLIRRQFEVVHRWSEERAELVQGITGISWYYRQFGYEYVLALGGGQPVDPQRVPAATDTESETYSVRPATPDDAPFLTQLDEQARRRVLVACCRDEAMWRYEVDGRSDRGGARPMVALIEDDGGRPVGFIVHEGRLYDRALQIVKYELAPNVSWMAATPAVLRYLVERGRAYEARPSAEALARLMFYLDGEHPAHRWLPYSAVKADRPYAWYVRVADPAAFVRHVASVLEARIAAAGAPDLTCDVLLSFYRSGLRIAFEQGRLVAAEPWHPEQHRADASFPDLTFLKLLFGYRSLSELRDAFPDCSARDTQAAALIDALFPKQPSLVWPVA